MTSITPRAAAAQTAFGEALADFLSARDALDALPVETTSSEDELRAMDAMGAAERRLFDKTPQTVADIRALAEIAWSDIDAPPTADMIGKVLSGLRVIDGQPSRVFNAAKWVADFRRFGGGWVVTDTGVQLLQPVPAGDQLDNLMWELRTRGGEDAVKAIIQAGEPIATPASEAPDRLRWENIKRRFEVEVARMKANEATPYRGTIDDPECAKAEALTGQIVDAYDASADELLRFPAPHAEALRFKLALLAEDRFTMCQHNDAGEFAKIVAADADRLLAEG